MTRDPSEMLQPLYSSTQPYAVTFGPEVGAVCAAAGYAPDPEQQMILDNAFAYTAEGLPASFELGIAGPRQQLKTGALIQLAIGWLYVLPGIRNVSWTAHLKETAVKSFGELSTVIRGADFLLDRMPDDRTRGIFQGKDVERIVTGDGRTLRVSARTETGSRGLTGDRVALDEALYLTPGMVGSLISTLTARSDAQGVYAGTAGEISSAVWRTKRDAGRKGMSRGLTWREWGAPYRPCERADCAHYPPEHAGHVAGCAYDDEDLWRLASPLLGRRRPNGTGLTLERMRALRNAVLPAEWARDFLVWWDDPEPEDAQEAARTALDEVMDRRRWPKLLAKHEDSDGVEHVGLPPRADYDLESVGVAVSADLTSAAIVGAGVRASSAKRALKLIATGPGYSWTLKELRALREQFPRCRVILDPKGPSTALYADAKRERFPRITATTMDQWIAANQELYTALREGTVEHGGQAELDACVKAARGRRIRDRVVLERYGYDASPLDAAILALWGVKASGVTTSAYEERTATAL